MVKLRLRRAGKKKHPIYKIVAADIRSPRDGRFIEAVGQSRSERESDSSHGEGGARILLAEERCTAHRYRSVAPSANRALVALDAAEDAESMRQRLRASSSNGRCSRLSALSVRPTAGLAGLTKRRRQQRSRQNRLPRRLQANRLCSQRLDDGVQGRIAPPQMIRRNFFPRCYRWRGQADSARLDP